MSDFIENKLKKMSVKDLETIIAKAISDATGEEFEASISTVDYGTNYLMPEATFQVRLAHPSEWGKDA